MQKYRVFCPHCDVSLLVTEDLLGQPGNCPGCNHEFLLPTVEMLRSSNAAVNERSVPETPPAAESTRRPSAGEEAAIQSVFPAPQTGGPKPVRIERRSTLRVLSSLLKGLAIVLLLAGCIVLIVLLIAAMRTTPSTTAVLSTIGIAIGIACSALPTFAFAELILVFLAQEEMLRRILNSTRASEAKPSSRGE